MRIGFCKKPAHRSKTGLMSAGNSTATTFNEEYTEYQLHRSALRRFVRRFYLRHAASLCRGRVLDLGCGIGELLELLPPGSRGLEVNPASVRHCQARGLPVDLYDPVADESLLKNISPGRFETLIISHVLEHLENPALVLRTLAAACVRRSISRIVVIVPGLKGYQSDITHRTFVTETYLKEAALLPPPGYRVAVKRFFPFNLGLMGRYFRHNELTVVFDSLSEV